MDYIEQYIDCNRSQRRRRARLTLAATVAGLVGVGSSMLVVGVIVFGIITNMSVSLSTIMHAVLRGMGVSHRGRLVLIAQRHRNRMQVLQRQAGDQHQHRKFFQKIPHAIILSVRGPIWQEQD